MNLVPILPHLTASLNGLSLVLLLVAFVLIRSGQRERHRKTMLAAVAASGLFLAFYLIYHFTTPIFVFLGQGPIRTVYYILLISHVLLAMVIVPMIVFTLFRAQKGRVDAHRAIARWTFPLWVYVSVSGLAVYTLLYHVYPPPVG